MNILVVVMEKEAILYDKLDGNLNCRVCARNCVISPGKLGFCQTRKNVEGKLKTLIYAAVSSLAVDPIEKKTIVSFFTRNRSIIIGDSGL